MFYFNPLDIATKSIIGAVSNKQNLILNVFTLNNYCNLILLNDLKGEKTTIEMQKTSGGFTAELSLEVGIYYYHFESDGVKYYRDDNFLASSNGSETFQLLVYDNSYKVPSLGGGIIYQIFPDRFNRKGKDFTLPNGKIKRKWGEEPYYKPNDKGKILNNDFFGGNFLGIIEKLDYLKELGVTLIYLNPITKAYSNHRYDTANYFEIDELLGDEKDLKLLIDKAHEKGIKIMLDGVYNHTGDDSIYFNKYGSYDTLGAYQSKDSPYYDWYVFNSYPNKYECWWGIDVLPMIDKKSTKFQEYISGENGVIAHFMDLGVDGFRLDVVDELSSTFVKKIRKIIKSKNPNGIILGEVWEDATNKIAYGEKREYFLGNELDSVMNYPLKDAIINYLLSGDEKVLTSVIKTQINNYPKKALDILMNLLGTHDTARILTVLTGANTDVSRDKAVLFAYDENTVKLAIERLKKAVVLLYTLYGLPTIYYGDEREMLGFKDPFNRKCINWKKSSPLIDFYRKLGEIRRGEKVFKDGELQIIHEGNGAIIFKRYIDNEEVIIGINLGKYHYTIKSDSGLINLFTKEKSDKFILKEDEWLIVKPV